jgi:hypothetical protein
MMQTEKSLLLWDLENIPLRYIDKIYGTLKIEPTFVVVSTARDLTPFERLFITNFNLHYLKANNDEIADRVLIDYALKHLHSYDRFIILSSDSDFVPLAKKIATTPNKRVTIFTISESNYRIVFYLLNSYKNLQLYSLDATPLEKHFVADFTSTLKPNNFFKRIKEGVANYLNRVKAIFQKLKFTPKSSIPQQTISQTELLVVADIKEDSPHCICCKKEFPSYLVEKTFNNTCKSCKDIFFRLYPPSKRTQTYLEKFIKEFQAKEIIVNPFANSTQKYPNKTTPFSELRKRELNRKKALIDEKMVS